jgi:NADPH:quinone reductase
MVEVIRSTIVDAPIDQVWVILRDFNGHGTWHPAVSKSRIEDAVPVDMIGAIRDFELSDGSRIREQLLSLSDQAKSIEYYIVDAPLPLIGYVASMKLIPVTDGQQTYWQWHSRFTAPKFRETAMAQLVAENIYESGFRAVKQMFEKREKLGTSPPVASSIYPPARNTQGDDAKAVLMNAHGGAEVLQFQAIDVAKPQRGEVRIRQTYIGVNYIDVYARTGYFNLVSIPGIPGMEAVGVIESVGQGVDGFSTGDRVAYACAPPGAYTGLRVMNPNLLLHAPDFMSDQLLAASLLKGITASFLLHDVYHVKPGDVVLIHAAAGGVGLLLVQWAKNLGATVIGTTSSEEKADRVKRAGCDHVINYSQHDFVKAVMNVTNNTGVDVVYDAVGRDTFEKSLKSLKSRGTLVSFGQASGDIGSREIGKLAGNSATLCRPNFSHYTETRDDVLLHSNRFFAAVKSGAITIDSPRIFPLSDARNAHLAIESRIGTGSIILRA